MADRNCANCIHGDVCKKCSPLFGMYGCKDFMEESVRCKDCKHWDKVVGEAYRGFCFAWKVDSYDEDFCSYGERRNDG